MSAEPASVPDRTVRRVAAFFVAVAAVLVGVAVISVRNISGARAASDWVNQTHALILELDGIDLSFQAAEGSLRAYAATGAAGDLRAAREQLSALAEHVEVARATARSDGALAARIERLAGMTTTRSDAARALIAARQAGQPVAPLLAAEAWTTAGPAIKAEVAKLKEEQMALLAARDTEQFLQAQTTRWTVWAGVVLNLILLAGVVWLIRDDHAARNRAAQVLADANRQLESKVAERTADLTAANQRLQTENLERRWAAQAIEHQLRYNQLIVDSIEDPVLVLTKSRNISRVNPAAVHATGWEPAELVNRPLADLVTLQPAATGGLVEPFTRALAEGHELRDLPAWLGDKRGQRHPVRCTLFPLRDGNKVVGGIVILRRDAGPAPSSP
jgi:PAS domain S-box-containing protein